MKHFDMNGTLIELGDAVVHKTGLPITEQIIIGNVIKIKPNSIGIAWHPKLHTKYTQKGHISQKI